MKKRLLATLLSLCLMIGLLPTVAFADGTYDSVDYSTIFTYTTSNNEVTITGFKDSYINGLNDTEKFSIELVIPATIEDNPVVAIGEKAFAFSCGSYPQATSPSTYSVSSLSFEYATNLKSIGVGAFGGFTANGTLTFPDTCSDIEIGFQAFAYSSFESFEASPNTIKSIDSNALYHSALSGHIEIPEGVTTLGSTILGSTTVETITLPSTITSIGTYVFSNMNSLKFAKLNFDFNSEITISSLSDNGFMGQQLSDAPVLILKDKASYDYIYSETYSANRAFLAYEMTLTFHDLDSSYDRVVLYNHPINWEKSDENDDFSWVEDEIYTIPVLSGYTCWSFTYAAVLVGETLVSETSNVAGDTLYAVEMENITDSCTYYEFGSYPQTMFADAPNDETSTHYQVDLALVEAAEAEGREFYVYETESRVYWFEIEPILWRYIGSGTGNGETYYYLWSEYVLDQQAMGEDTTYTYFSNTPLYTWLNGTFTDQAFAEYEQDDFLSGSYTTLLSGTNYSVLSNAYGKNYVKAWKTDYANYIGSYNYYWLSDRYSVTQFYLVNNTTGGAAAPANNTVLRGVRPATYIFPDFDKYTTTGEGTFDNPYKFVLIETVSNSLAAGTYDEPQKFELGFSDDDADIIYTFQIDDGEEQIYDPDNTYYISKPCTVTAWATVDGVETAKASWEYTVTNPNAPELSNFEADDIIIEDNTDSIPDNFDIIKVPGITDDEGTALTAEIPSGYEYADEFHLYATVNGEIIENAIFTQTVNITLTNELDSSKTYQLLHLKDGSIVDVFSQEAGTLTVNAEENSISFEFDVNNLSPFMLVSNAVSSGSSSTTTYYQIDASTEGEGEISPTNSVLGYVQVKKGNSQTFTFTPADGYELVEVIVDGESLGVIDEYTFENVMYDHYISVIFENTDGSQATLNRDDHFAYMQGYPELDFRPSNNITRAETVVMFSRLITEAMDLDTTYSCSFSDITGDEWYANNVGFMEQFGIIEGYTDGTFGGDDYITRAEFATIASRFDELAYDGENDFTDVLASHWAIDYINSASTKGWINGYEDGTFKPEQNITRAEAVTLVNRVLDRYADMDFIEENIDEMITFPDVYDTFWAYDQILEATNGHDYVRNDDGTETWTSLK